MKFLLRSIIPFTIVAVFMFFGLMSCKKEKIIENTITVIDTVTVSYETPITTINISANKWMIQEKRGLNGGDLVYYLRGAGGNTESFDNEYIQFNSDHTGLYHENGGTDRNITWNFTNSTNSTMKFTLANTPSTFDIYWENMRLIGGKLYFDQFFTDGNTLQNNHSVDIRIPKP
ncbi:MAG: hypothetical protein ABIO04_12880 [Ferruginibacter sp.]